MASESGAVHGAPPSSSGVLDKGLKKGAIGYISNIVIGVASTAPPTRSPRRSASSSPSRASACTPLR